MRGILPPYHLPASVLLSSTFSLSFGLQLSLPRLTTTLRINNSHTALFRRNRAAFSLPHHTLRGPSNFNCQSTIVRWWWLISPRALLAKPKSPANKSELDLSVIGAILACDVFMLFHVQTLLLKGGKCPF